MIPSKECPNPLWIDDLCFENILDILEGKKTVEPGVLKMIIETGRVKIRYTRSRHKANLTRITNLSNFAKSQKKKTIKTK